MEEAKSYNFQRTEIVPGLRVSSAAIYYDEYTGPRWQYETWIFSDIPGVSSKQVIHGSHFKPRSDRLEEVGKRYHRRIVKVLERAKVNCKHKWFLAAESDNVYGEVEEIFHCRYCGEVKRLVYSYSRKEHS